MLIDSCAICGGGISADSRATPAGNVCAACHDSEAWRVRVVKHRYKYEFAPKPTPVLPKHLRVAANGERWA